MTKKKQESLKNNINGSIMISELVEKYPSVVEMLVTEWGFHCANCIISSFETLEQGASVHGIVDLDFEIMLEMVNDIANQNLG